MKQSWVKSTSVPEESEIQITNNQATISSEAFEDNSEHINIPVIETSEGEVVKDIEVELPKVDEQGQASVISFDEVAEGATVTIKEDADATEEHSIEELTVILPSGDAQVEIDMPNTTVTIVSSDGEELVIEEVIVGTADETFIVKENVYIKKLTVKCGNVEVYGRVGEIKRHADYKTDGSPATIYVYEIDNGEVGSIGEGVSFASNMNGVVTSEAQLVSALNIQAGDRAEITLGDNITLTKAVNVPEGTYVTLNLNGKSIANTNDYIFENKANLTIDGEGTLEGMGIIRSTTGKVTINNGNYYASSQWQNGVYQHTLKAENSEVEINGGNFDATMKGQTNAMFNASTGATITINAGNFKNVNGTLSNFDPYLFTYENDGKVIIKNGTFYGGWRFNGTTATTEIYGGNFTIGFDGQSFHANSTHGLTIYGGTFTPNESYPNNSLTEKLNDVVAEGYKATQTGKIWIVTSTDITPVSNAEELSTAVASGAANLLLMDGEYQINGCKSKTLTISGTKNAVINVIPAGQGEANGQLDYNLDGANVTFNGVTIKTNSQLYAGYARLSAVYNNCVIQNTYNLGVGNSEFYGCEFNITNEYLRVGGAYSAKFDGCTFNTDGRAILVFQDGTSHAQTVTVKDCTFNATAAAKTWNGIHVAAVSCDGTNGTYTVNLEGNNVVGSNFNGLWQIKTGEANITINE